MIDESSHPIRLNKLLGYSQEVVLFMSGLLHDIEECIFHYQLSQISKLVIQEQKLMVAEVFFLVNILIDLLLLVQLNYHTNTFEIDTGSASSSISIKELFSFDSFSIS